MTDPKPQIISRQFTKCPYCGFPLTAGESCKMCSQTDKGVPHDVLPKAGHDKY